MDNQTLPPVAVFLGDFNAGKSAIINALAGARLVPVEPEETCSLPTVVGGSLEEGRVHLLGHSGAKPIDLEDFLQFKQTATTNGQFAFSAGSPRLPFCRLHLLDMPGGSGAGAGQATIPPAAGRLAVLVADAEYWFAKHSLQLLAELVEHWEGEVIVLANKADLLNAQDIKRIQKRAAQRMTEFGIRRLPPFLTVSAKLEFARRLGDDATREEVRPAVCDLCDRSFDAFRLRLYEFEARSSRQSLWEDLPGPSPAFAWSLLQGQKGETR